MGNGRRFGWDSCVFISVLTGIGRTAEDLSELRALADLVDAGEVQIYTPAITLIEVLACHLSPEQESQFQELLNLPNIEVVSVSRMVAEKAREIRNFYREQQLEMAVPDSIHLATAILYGANALHTYDGCGKRKKKTDLLALDQPLIGKYDLKICKPTAPKQEKKATEVATLNLTTMRLFRDEE